MPPLRVTPAVLLLVGLAACSSSPENAQPAPDASADSHAAGAHTGHVAATQMGTTHGYDLLMRGQARQIEPSADYPLTTCAVSGEPLGGDMGPVIAYEYRGQEIQLCCRGCVDEFSAAPHKFAAKVRSAAANK